MSRESGNRFKWSRKPPHRFYRKTFFIVTEGAQTEVSYMNCVKNLAPREINIVICSRKTTHSGIKHLIVQGNNVLKNMMSGDEAWILLDRDEAAHTREQFGQLHKWCCQSRGWGNVAISNPRFEYWILLHFEEYPSVATAKKDSALEKYLQGYSKRKDLAKFEWIFDKERILQAIHRALKQPELPDCEHPDRIGSGVALLMDKIFKQR